MNDNNFLYSQIEGSVVPALPVFPEDGESIRVNAPIDYTDAERQKMLAYYSDNEFYDPCWVIKNNRTEMNLQASKRTIRFPKKLHRQANVDLRDYILSCLSRRFAVSTLKQEACHIGACLGYVMEKPIHRLTQNDLFQIYSGIVESDSRGKTTKAAMWYSFLRFLKAKEYYDLAEMCERFPVLKAEKNKKKTKKYIPDTAVKMTDAIFRQEKVPLVLRGIYWSIRLFPTRIDEGVSMKNGCLKQVNEDEYAVSFPTSKQSGSFDRALSKIVFVRNEGMGAYYISLLKEQQAFFDSLEDPADDFLWKYQAEVPSGRASVSGYKKPVKTMTVENFSAKLRQICKQYGVRDDDGNLISLGTHQFRHNAITDRLSNGFRLVDVASLAGHHSTTMTSQAYAHNVPEEKPVVFRGRVINTDNARLMAMVLKNPFARRTRLGLCADTSECTKNNAGCLKCEHFTPNTEYIDYYVDELNAWQSKYDSAVAIGNTSFASLCEEWVQGYTSVIQRVHDAVSHIGKEGPDDNI